MDHPKDHTLRFPLVTEDLRDPNLLVQELFEEYITNKQEYDTKNNILYRKYDKYWKLDSISCFFTEKVRIKCRLNGKPTMIEVWKSLEPEVIRTFQNIDHARSELLYTYKAGECNLFSPALALRMILGFNETRAPLKVIDPSSGWGDRAIAAIAAGDFVSEYIGYDPNEELIIPYKNLKETLDHYNKCTFICEPFEKADVKEKYYDIGITSPPYFDLEEYSDAVTQSVSGIKKEYQTWLKEFYYKYLDNLCKAVKDSGKIVIYVSSYSSKGKFYDLENQTIKTMSKNGWKQQIRGELRNSPDDKPRNPRPFFVFTK